VERGKIGKRNSQLLYIRVREFEVSNILVGKCMLLDDCRYFHWIKVPSESKQQDMATSTTIPKNAL